MYILLSTIIFFLTTSLIIAYPLLPRVSLPLPFSVLATSCMTKIYRNEEGSQKIKQNRRQWIVKLIFHKNHSTLVTENKTKFRAKITMLLYRAFHKSWEWFLTPWWHIDFIWYLLPKWYSCWFLVLISFDQPKYRYQGRSNEGANLRKENCFRITSVQSTLGKGQIRNIYIPLYCTCTFEYRHSVPICILCNM